MKIAVIAANGRSGRAFVEHALAKGHSIVAGVHNGELGLSDPKLTVLHCDATNLEDVKRLITGQDAVVSFIGHVKNSPPSVQTDAIKVIAAAMEAQHLKRIISLTGTGVRFAGDRISLIDRFLNFGVKLVDPKRIQDGQDHVDFLRQSSLDWTIIRVLKLQNTQPGKFSLTPGGPSKLIVSRQEVARAVEQVLVSNEYTKQAPIISPAQ